MSAQLRIDAEPDGDGSTNDDVARFSPRPNRAAEIAWRPWSEAAFAEARAAGKPVLLSLSAVWCHWCHVMDETSYSEPLIIAAINSDYIPVRVDNDRHPDVNRRYNMGGWPTTVFLTAAGEVLTGGTYLPPEQMVDTLARVREYYAANRENLLSDTHESPADPGLLPARQATGKARAPLEELAELEATVESEMGSGRQPLTEAVPASLEQLVNIILRARDRQYGGFGSAPKFPQAEALALLLAYAGHRPDTGEAFTYDATADVASQTTGSERTTAVEALVTTLDRMRSSALWDSVERGFFRYATRRDWSEPHYEKMLVDNAKLALLYLDAAELAGSGALAATQAAGAGTSASADAAATANVVTSVAGDHTAATRWRQTAADVIDYLVTTLRLPDRPAFAGTQDADEGYYAHDQGARAKLTAPSVDQTVYVDWNALAARALLRAANVLEQPVLAERALAILDYLWEKGHGRRGMAHYVGGTVDGLLADQAEMTQALLDAYEVTGRRPYLARAEVLADWVSEHLSARNGRLLDRAFDGDPAGLLGTPVAAIDENGVMADAWLRLAACGGKPRFASLAARVLRAWSNDSAALSLAASTYGLALLRYLRPGPHIVIVGPFDDATTCALRRAATRLATPQRTIQHLDPAHDIEQIVRGGYTVERQAAYVCIGAICQPPTSDPAELQRLAQI